MQLATYERSGAQSGAVVAFRAEIEDLQHREDGLAAAIDELRRRADALRAERDMTRARVAAAKAGIAAHSAIGELTPEQSEIRTLLDDARERTMALQARAAALAELVARDANPPPRAEASIDREAFHPPDGR